MISVTLKGGRLDGSVVNLPGTPGRRLQPVASISIPLLDDGWWIATYDARTGEHIDTIKDESAESA